MVSAYQRQSFICVMDFAKAHMNHVMECVKADFNVEKRTVKLVALENLEFAIRFLTAKIEQTKHTALEYQILQRKLTFHFS